MRLMVHFRLAGLDLVCANLGAALGLSTDFVSTGKSTLALSLLRIVEANGGRIV